MEKPARVVVLLSGGLDSVTALAWLVSRPLWEVERVHALIFDYGQSSSAEVDKAVRICENWGVPFTYDRLDMGRDTDTHKEIPARNLIFIAQAAKVALSMGFNTIAIGAEPDSTYTDSSEQFLLRTNRMLNLFGLDLIAPVKALENKTAVLKQALDLGVPLHLCHSSRSNAVDGECKTSSRFLGSLASLFPYIDPQVLLSQLKRLRCGQADTSRVYCIHYRSESGAPHQTFKYPAALFTAATLQVRSAEVPVAVYTTGSWGDALTEALALCGRADCIKVTKTNWLESLRSQRLNCDSQVAQWGIKQALSLLPRPRYANTVSCRVVQGNLAKALNDLGYRVMPPTMSEGIILETAVA